VIRVADPDRWTSGYTDDESKRIFAEARNEVNGLKLNCDGIILKGDRVFVPAGKRSEIIHATHSSPSNAHPGISATVSALSRDFWWPNMRIEVAQEISRCETRRIQKVDRLPRQAICIPFRYSRRGNE
jgi:hypothetical protein